jgi:hypothetical protein
LAVACVVAIAGASLGLVTSSVTGAADEVVLHGTVTAAGAPLPGARISVSAATSDAPRRLAQTASDASGAFDVSYSPPDAGVLYVDAAAPGD